MQGRPIWLIAIACGALLAAPVGAGEKVKSKTSGGKAKAEAAKTAEGADEGAGAAPAAPAAPAAEAEPEFKTAKAKDTFQEGRNLFELGNYKDALANFKKAKDGAKTAADKAIVDRWITACQGGQVLDNYKKAKERGVLRDVLVKAMDNAERFKGTPIYTQFQDLIEALRSEVCLVLDNFDDPSPRFTKKMGKEFIKDPAIVFRGTACIQWTSLKDGKVSQMQFSKNLPRKWLGEFHSVLFWVRFVQPVDLKLIALSPGKPGQGEESNALEAVYSPTSTGGGWVRVEIPLDSFKPHGAGTFTDISKFLFMVESKSAFKLYLDDVMLLRKDPSERKAGATDGEGETKAKAGTSKKANTPTGRVKQTERKNK